MSACPLRRPCPPPGRKIPKPRPPAMQEGPWRLPRDASRNDKAGLCNALISTSPKSGAGLMAGIRCDLLQRDRVIGLCNDLALAVGQECRHGLPTECRGDLAVLAGGRIRIGVRQLFQGVIALDGRGVLERTGCGHEGVFLPVREAAHITDQLSVSLPFGPQMAVVQSDIQVEWQLAFQVDRL